MDPELNSSLQDPNPNISLYVESVREEWDQPDAAHLILSDQPISSSHFSVIDEQTHEAAQNRFNTYPDRYDSLVSLKEHYQFLDWTYVISSSLTGIYAKFVRHETKSLERGLEIERQNKKLVQCREHLEENFREFLSKLKASH